MTLQRVLLCVESSCDETAAAVIREDGAVLSNVVASQAALHERFGGVVPEIASRAHVIRILPVIDEALRRARTNARDLSAVAVMSRPGLVGSLLVGITAAKALAWSLSIPLIALDHIAAHIFACQAAADEPIFPCIGFVVSGGHTNLYDCNSATDMTLIGSTIDDAAGEAFDKVARILDLPYPGGPSIERMAASGDPAAVHLPRPLLKTDRLEFSFSGLKTAVMYAARGVPGATAPVPELTPQRRADLAAAFQEAAVDVLVGKAKLALERYSRKMLCLGGGVACNRLLRDRLEEMCRRAGARLAIAPLEFCTDNAGMGGIAWQHFHAKRFADLTLDARPGLVRIGDS